MPTTEDPAQLLNSNQLGEAVQAALEMVKSKPADTGLRVQLAELLCLSGDLERADKQLDTASTQEPKIAVRCALLRQLIRAATARQECFDQGRPPELLGPVDEVMDLQLKLLLAVREEGWTEAAELAQKIETTRKRQTVSGSDFNAADARDQDDFWAGTLELLTSTGKYYWVPISRIESLSVYPPETPSELLWAIADIGVEEGPTGRVYLPTTYPLFGADASVPIRLGRETQWREPCEGFGLGSGLRLWWLGDEEKTLFELTDLTFGETPTPTE